MPCAFPYASVVSGTMGINEITIFRASFTLILRAVGRFRPFEASLGSMVPWIEVVRAVLARLEAAFGP